MLGIRPRKGGALTVLLIIRDGLRCGFARFKLCAHFLDLRGLFFHRRSERFNFLLLLRHRTLEGVL